MNLTALCLRRPVATCMAVLIVVILGVISFLKIPVDLLPEITFPRVTVSTSYPNVGPLEMETLVTVPVEKAVSSVEGVEDMTSVSVEGRSQVRVSFGWSKDLEVAVSDIRARIDRIRDDLPPGAEAPVVSKYDVNASPIMFIGVSGQMDPVALRTFVEEEIRYRLERVAGVAAADWSARSTSSFPWTGSRPSISRRTRSSGRCGRATSTCRPAMSAGRTWRCRYGPWASSPT